MRNGFAGLRRVLIEEPMKVVGPLAIFGVTLLVCWIVRRLLMRALRAWNQSRPSRAGQILTQALRGPTLMWCFILAAHIGMQSSELPARLTRVGAEALLVLWAGSMILMCVRLAGDLVRLYGDQIPGALPVTTLTQNLAQISVAITGSLILLWHFGLSPAPILTALGVGGLAVALALQDTLSNLFGGFYVAVARQLRPGDYIRLNTGEEGYVNDIGWRCTTIRAPNDNMIIVPNAKLSQAIVTNFSMPEKRMGSSVQVTVAMNSDAGLVERVLLEIGQHAASEIDAMRTDPAPSVMFDPGFTETGLGFSLNYQVSDFASQTPVRSQLRKRILSRFNQLGISLAYPVRNVYVQSMDTLTPGPDGKQEK